MKDKRVIFMGTPEFSVKVLESLLDITNVVLVVTKEDSYVGRKKVLTPSKVKECALKYGIPVLTPKSLKEEYESILAYKPDIIITSAYGKIVPKEILDYPKYGCINIHASILPKYRGASPISASILNGDGETGITIMHMDEGLDTGDIIEIQKTLITEFDNLETLTNKLSNLAVTMLPSTLESIFTGTNKRIKQDESESSYVSILTKEDEKLDFNENVSRIRNHIRSIAPNPGAYIMIDNEVIKVLDARIGNLSSNKEVGIIKEVGKDYFGITCADGIIEIIKIKKAGKNAMLVKDFFNGYKSENLIGKKVNYEKK